MGALRMSSGTLSRRGLLSLGVCAAIGPLFWPRRAGASTSELVVIVNPANKANLSADDIGDIFRTVMRTWPGGRPIATFELPANTDERVFFDRAVLKMEPDDVAHFWIDRRIRGGAPPPHQVPDPAVLTRVVAKMENAIGYAPPQLVDASVRIVAHVRTAGVVTGFLEEGGRSA